MWSVTTGSQADAWYVQLKCEVIVEHVRQVELMQALVVYCHNWLELVGAYEMLKSTKSVLLMAVASAMLFSQSESLADSATTGIPIRYAAGHMIVIPVKVNDIETNFVLDTGAGVNVISQTLAEKLACRSDGKVTGQRMSGQKVTMKLVNLSSLRIGSCRKKNLPMATWKLEDAFAGAPELAQVDGLVSLEFFKNIPFTIDYAQKMVFIEDNESLKMRVSRGVSIPIQVSSKPNQTSVTMLVWFSNGSHAKVEVDTGSGALILDEHYMRELGVNQNSIDVKTVQGVDETGYSYVRYFTKLPLDVFLAQNRQFTQIKPNVQFQKIIYDGLIGDGFMRNFTVTYDLPHKRIIFERYQ
ncbi:MAG: clan AA aspartic protease [Cyanobacteria bacterium SZAS-4]|nr:clan AA aspartic protease [Cyanobacteria bacterium SZAS-4]